MFVRREHLIYKIDVSFTLFSDINPSFRVPDPSSLKDVTKRALIYERVVNNSTNTATIGTTIQNKTQISSARVSI